MWCMFGRCFVLLSFAVILIFILKCQTCVRNLAFFPPTVEKDFSWMSTETARIAHACLSYVHLCLLKIQTLLRSRSMWSLRRGESNTVLNTIYNYIIVVRSKTRWRCYAFYAYSLATCTSVRIFSLYGVFIFMSQMSFYKEYILQY